MVNPPVRPLSTSRVSTDIIWQVFCHSYSFLRSGGGGGMRCRRLRRRGPRHDGLSKWDEGRWSPPFPSPRSLQEEIQPQRRQRRPLHTSRNFARARKFLSFLSSLSSVAEQRVSNATTSTVSTLGENCGACTVERFWKIGSEKRGGGCRLANRSIAPPFSSSCGTRHSERD